jgi:hypothetical protein
LSQTQTLPISIVHKKPVEWSVKPEYFINLKQPRIAASKTKKHWITKRANNSRIIRTRKDMKPWGTPEKGGHEENRAFDVGARRAAPKK